ncbi:hypothetical protein PIB30_053446 [Stylosanthes scabra]|uniref:Fe2OG dioxygenase domain-containing protein n=1 Tax=Stylosanthes scabra TaxID=79078 RepID=A0ABU6SIF2_9FABA|nr:hypothetical protein [Stylosanthes scabra]
MGSQTRSSSPFPVIDLSHENMKAGTEAWVAACRVARTGMEEHGCFVVRFDKVTESLCKSLVSAMEQLFGLPMETKAQKTSDKPFHGYLGQVSWIPLYESLGIDDPLSISACQKFANIMWPQQPINRFCETVNEYAKLLGEIDHIAKRMVFESYGVDMERCKDMIESSEYLLRCQQYRPPEKDEIDMGLQPHTDLTIISVVHQLNNLNGLEIKASDGVWRGVDASPSSFVVMAGDALKVWSNGRIRPCEHKVMMSDVKTMRYSMGLFSFCANTLEMPPELVDQEHPLRYKTTFHHHDYLRFFDESKIKDLDTRMEAYCGI